MLPARPEPVPVPASKTAVIVIDMQNAYASPGGYLDLAGFDISGAAKSSPTPSQSWKPPAPPGIQVIYFQNGWDCDYCRSRGPVRPNYHKSNALKTMRARPELQGSCWPVAAGL